MHAKATNTSRDARGYGGSLTLYHPTGRGNGAAFRLEPRMEARDNKGGCFFMEMATQDGIGKDHRPASFDWENKITVRLDFSDVCELLAVFEGESERAGGKRDGLFHRNGSANTLIRLERHESGGFAVSLSRKRTGEETPQRIWTVLTAIEALGIRHVLATGLFFMANPRWGSSTGAGTSKRNEEGI